MTSGSLKTTVFGVASSASVTPAQNSATMGYGAQRGRKREEMRILKRGGFVPIAQSRVWLWWESIGNGWQGKLPLEPCELW